MTVRMAVKVEPRRDDASGADPEQVPSLLQEVVTLCDEVRYKVAAFCIRFKIPMQAWQASMIMSWLAMSYGGDSISDHIVAFENRRDQLDALDALCFQYGPEYFELVDSVDYPELKC